MTSPRRSRQDPEWQMLISEYQALKRKLHSKSEALLILSKDLGAAHKERDYFKHIVDKLKSRCQGYRKQLSEYKVSGDQAALLQMIKDARNQKLAHQQQNEILEQKLKEALGDVKLLRERFARERVGDEGVGSRCFQAHEKTELVEQLEKSTEETKAWMLKYNEAIDQVEDLKTDCTDYKQKADRLSTELSYILSGDKKRIIDIDALCMENKYLQERVKQCQEEKNALHAQITKYKRNTKDDFINQNTIKSSGLILSPRQVKDILQNPPVDLSPKSVTDLQSIASALLETINDKNLALHHLRNTNKILGNRVSELEGKLKALEVSGLWSLQNRLQNVPSLSSSDEVSEEFMSNLGSRLAKITDSKVTVNQENLVSFTSDEDSSNGHVTASPETFDQENDKANDPNQSKSDTSIAEDKNNADTIEATSCLLNGANHNKNEMYAVGSTT